ncbi:MAG: GGDEF domain-containing protein, partial [Leptospiraceae bacterium]|nr:GGDEF domain-containing protein [Leptospiraceae bacterium]
QYGHLAGDLILKEISKILQKLRKADLAARLGGEEFVILMPHTGLEKASLMAERVRSEIEETQFTLGNGEVIHCTISIGLTSIFQDDTSIEDILRRADQALYMSKNSGRNRVCKFSM